MSSKEDLGVIIISYSKICYNFFMDNIVLILLGLLIYILISIFVMKPYVRKKAKTEIGGNLVVKSDPLLIILPILFAILLFVFWKISIISNTNS